LVFSYSTATMRSVLVFRPDKLSYATAVMTPSKTSTSANAPPSRTPILRLLIALIFSGFQ
jgi:hypothetical protein